MQSDEQLVLDMISLASPIEDIKDNEIEAELNLADFLRDTEVELQVSIIPSSFPKNIRSLAPPLPNITAKVYTSSYPPILFEPWGTMRKVFDTLPPPDNYDDLIFQSWAKG
jgi:hypothetical protein